MKNSQICFTFLFVLNVCFSVSSEESTNNPEISPSPTSPSIGDRNGLGFQNGGFGGYDNFYKPNYFLGGYNYQPPPPPPPPFPLYGYNFGYNFGYGYPNGFGYGVPFGYGYGYGY